MLRPNMGCASCSGPVAMGDMTVYPTSIAAGFQSGGAILPNKEEALDIAKTALYSSMAGVGLYWLGLRPRTIVTLGLAAYVLQSYLAYRRVSDANGV